MRALRDVASGEILDASANINPLGPPWWLRQELERNISGLVHYPDPESVSLVEKLSKYHGCAPEEIVVANGSSELFAWLPLALGPMPWIVAVPCYGEYRRAPRLAGRRVIEVPLGVAPVFELDFPRIREALSNEPSIVLLGHPNNPSGSCLDVQAVRAIAQAFPSSVFVVDEAFGDFVNNFDSFLPNRPPNVIVLRSATKIAAIPGLRLGWLVATAHFSQHLRRMLPPWSVNHLAQAVGLRWLDDTDHATETRECVTTWRSHLADKLRSVAGITVYPGAANWLLVRVDREDLDAAALCRSCLQNGVALRNCQDFPGLESRWVRIAVRMPAENARVADTLAKVVGQNPAGRRVAPTQRARALMIQGCSSDAGKSVLAAALCRCLVQDGFRVAPFKAQNMSNNSGVDAMGGEMGRAQVMQAFACGLEPDCRMNPILLKPNSETGSQVVVRGSPVANQDFGTYMAAKQQYLDAALDAYDSLAREFDVLICEGAGSPGEVNLKQHDIVNMGFVRRRDMPVLLVGDIDRGGVFASFVGHMEVFDEWERSHVAGFIVNRFRGDVRLLGNANNWVEQHTGTRVLGIVPFLQDLNLPAEDRLALSREGLRRNKFRQAPLDIAVLDLPHLSNFTDIDPLAIEPDVTLRLVDRPADLGAPDAIIIPGTKNTIADLARLQENGMLDAVRQAHAHGAELVGLCGGFQMLGRHISDPDKIESNLGQVEGLGLLPLATVMDPNKTLCRTTARHVQSGLTVHGYEIHHGTTTTEGGESAFVRDDGQVVGVHARETRVWGTYLHGVFDNDNFRRWWLDTLRERKGLRPLGHVQAIYTLGPSLDRLADVFRQSVNLEAIYRILGVR